MKVITLCVALLVASVSADPRRSRRRRPNRASPETTSSLVTQQATQLESLTQTQTSIRQSNQTAVTANRTTTTAAYPLITIPVLPNYAYDASVVDAYINETTYAVACKTSAGPICPGPGKTADVTVGPSLMQYFTYQLSPGAAADSQDYSAWEQWQCNLSPSNYTCFYGTYRAGSPGYYATTSYGTNTAADTQCAMTVTAGAEKLGSTALPPPDEDSGAGAVVNVFAGLFGQSDRVTMVVFSAFAVGTSALAFWL